MRIQVSSTAQQISADQSSPAKLINTGATVYYKTTPDVSSSSNDGNIASGATLTISGPKWLATASGATTAVDVIDVDAFGYEYTQIGAPISNEGSQALSTLTGTPVGAISGTSLTVTGAVSGAAGTFTGLLKPNAGVDVQAALTGPVYLSRQVAANRVIGNNLLAADANNAFNILGDGKHQWGAGGASAVDTNLYRSAADTLKTDDALIVTGTLASAAQTLTTETLSGTGKTALAFSDTTTTTGLTIGADVNLYRNAADVLKTDDALVAVGSVTGSDGVTTKVVAGVVSDGSFTTTPASGTIALDSTNSKLYMRVGSTWKSVDLA